MRIKFTPQRHDDRLEVSVSGDVLTINGEAVDFGPVPEGATLPREAVTCDWLASDVERIGGQITLTLICPYGPHAPEETEWHDAPHSAFGDGPVPLPLYEIEPVEEPAE